MRRLWLAPAAIASLVAGLVAIPPAATAANTFATNPAGFAYKSVSGVAQYGHPNGMLITGRCNRYDPEFAAARANGAEVLAYLDAPARPDSSGCALDNEFYLGDPSRVPLWPYAPRVNFPDTHLTDITA